MRARVGGFPLSFGQAASKASTTTRAGADAHHTPTPDSPHLTNNNTKKTKKTTTYQYNTLDAALPQYDAATQKVMRLSRAAFIGFCASFVSDCCSNSIRVIKTAKQTVTTPMSYGEVIKMVVEKDGVGGLFGRGLRTKLISNGIQGVMFSVLWRLGQDAMAAKEKQAKADADAAAKGKKKK